MASRVILLVLLCLFCVNYTLSNLECSKETLSLLHIIFRHGNKTLEGIYPTDPYINETYNPFGKGQLTNSGKLMGYRTGQYLRKKYGKFLGSYSSELLEAYASPLWRCKEYLQLIMASLYPPHENDRWHDEFNWNPIPYNNNCSLSASLFWTYATCPNFPRHYENYKKSKKYDKIMAPYKNTIRYLEDNSGLWANNSYVFGAAIFLQASFMSQEEWGLKLPSWTNDIWPKTLTKIAALEWTQIYSTEETQTLGSGFIISKIIKDTYLKINKDDSAKGRKIYLYVGHDTNIYGTLAWLGILKPEIVNYGAFVTFEIHDIHDTHYIKILYQNSDVSSKPVSIKIPNCGYCCPLEEFVKLYSTRLNPEKKQSRGRIVVTLDRRK